MSMLSSFIKLALLEEKINFFISALHVCVPLAPRTMGAFLNFFIICIGMEAGLQGYVKGNYPKRIKLVLNPF